MRVSELLQTFADWLESPDNEALLLAEYDENSLLLTADALIRAAEIIKQAAEELDVIEPPEESHITPESLDELGNIITSFDESNDPKLQKQAAVLDELLLTVAAPPGAFQRLKAAMDKKLEELEEKYHNPSKELTKLNSLDEATKEVENHPAFKQKRPLEAPLSTRTCPDHPGVPLRRIEDHLWQCSLDNKQYNFNAGYTLNDGTHVPGTSVEHQNDVEHTRSVGNNFFDSRDTRLGYRL